MEESTHGLNGIENRKDRKIENKKKTDKKRKQMNKIKKSN